MLVTDGAGNSANAPIYHVSPSQVDFVVPQNIGSGVATVTIRNNGGIAATGAAMIYGVAPALISADGYGSGHAAAVAVSGYNVSCVAQCGVVGCAPKVIDMSGGATYLSFFGTGIRNASSVSVMIGNENATVTYHGPQNTHPGLDHNLLIPPDLAGRGRLDVIVTVNGQASNPVWITLSACEGRQPAELFLP